LEAIMGETRTVHDPFLGKDVEVSDNLIDRLRGKYAQGPTMPNGEPEFGWTQFETPSIQREAADEIERLRKSLTDILDANKDFRDGMPEKWDGDPLQDACDRARQALARSADGGKT
jgi:hypothetical protein